jgi:hypothetical protein
MGRMEAIYGVLPATGGQTSVAAPVSVSDELTTLTVSFSLTIEASNV